MIFYRTTWLIGFPQKIGSSQKIRQGVVSGEFNSNFATEGVGRREDAPVW